MGQVTFGSPVFYESPWEATVEHDLLKYFEYKHLPPKLQEVSKPVCELARQIDQLLPDGPEKTVGLRKLLEGKDCFVRAALRI